MAKTPAGVRSVPYDTRFLDASWRWFTTTDLGALTDTAPFTREQQRAWFDGLPGRTDYVVWGIELDGQPVGAFGLRNIVAGGDAEHWGFVGEQAAWGHGIGEWFIRTAVAEARARGVQRLSGYIVPGNEGSRRIHEKVGFALVPRPEGGTLVSLSI